ncbi:cytochrome P450 [Pseudogulbenkiania sp. NH8B]|uniref:cytochrome P450 n=1 Tax=Pseudogulbenkiania sp. (strain NH8B) TaxID=748280 RepID=UPI0002279789|nr:cytochrome P450 [Pseudogulbenkiania sp. NH8B]BAK75559.1 cytochrome P450 [Pseudogulbenkiania sp. NH8B]
MNTKQTPPRDAGAQRPSPDWDARAPAVLQDQIRAYDDMRHRCPVAYSEYLNWSLFRHDDVMQALTDPKTFSNAVSSYPSIPNGMDPPEHTAYRMLIDPYFAPEAMARFEPVCRRIAVDLVRELPSAGEVELMGQFAEDFALQIQCAFMGWPVALHDPLRRWTHRNRAATLAADRAAMAAVALEFDGYIRAQLDARRAAGDQAPDDVTRRLLGETLQGRTLSDAEIVCIVRNWTVGELSTISSCVGILTQYLAERAELQQRLRQQPELLPAAIDEILRIHAPLIANRRIATRDVEIGGCQLKAGDRVTLIWASANRDETVFGDADEFRLDRDPADNLLYGAGIHVCPGAPLARLELKIVMEALLSQTERIGTVAGKTPVRASYPASGYASLPLWIERAAGPAPQA